MSEKKAEYKTEVDDAMEMLGKGYDHAPAVTIMPPVTEIAMGEEPGFFQTKTPAFVKLSTAFKKHMKNLKGSRLAVWLYIALSINDNGRAFPGLEAIMRDTGYSNREVIDSIREIEELGYFTVMRREGRSSLYQILDFASIGKDNQPTSELTSPVKKTAPTSEVSSVTSEVTSLKPELNQTKKQEFNNNISEQLSKISKLYESEIGVITPFIADALQDADTTYPEGWVQDAIEAAARRNARSWSYVEAILKRWKKDGKNAPFQPATNYKTGSAQSRKAQENADFFARLKQLSEKEDAPNVI